VLREVRASVIPVEDDGSVTGFVFEQLEDGSLRILMNPRHRFGHAVFFAIFGSFCIFWVTFAILYPHGIVYVDGKQTAGYDPNMDSFISWWPILFIVSMVALGTLQHSMWLLYGVEEWKVAPNEVIIARSLFGLVKRWRHTNSIIEVDHRSTDEGYSGSICLLPVGASKWKTRTIYTAFNVEDVETLAKLVSDATGWRKEPIAKLWRSKS
jgi:hypothetical protein